MERMEVLVDKLMSSGFEIGKNVVIALVIFVVGRYLISLVNKLVRAMMERRQLDPAIRSFLGSMINIVLMVLLLISVVGALGVQTTSFAALLASAGIAVGMALSGNMQNFAGGLMILFFKPYKIGDFIETQNVMGTVKEIQIFHTILTTPDNKIIFIPNGPLSNGVLTNFSHQLTRRIEWTFGVEYGTDLEKVKQILTSLIEKDSRILLEPTYLIALNKLADSSVNVVVRAWTKNEDYWSVYFEMNQSVYTTFNKEGINFPFPQLVVHHNKE
ncbi:MAG: mechanosensitive ion channel [Paludibacteraceae bacterium]|nr:mechanosensitive ion channel [Paludibacteraceae bacterium]MBP8781787.1 mechanosensitive ion channel [Paludibacteraceae bacterium]